MKNEGNHDENIKILYSIIRVMQMYSFAVSAMSSCAVVWEGATQLRHVSKPVVFNFSETNVYSGCLKHYAFRHQQSHSAALPNLLFGYNYRGFVGAIEWLL